MSIQSSPPSPQPWQTIAETGQEEKTVRKEGRRRREGEGTVREGKRRGEASEGRRGERLKQGYRIGFRILSA
jgi:hypothetical protein